MRSFVRLLLRRRRKILLRLRDSLNQPRARKNKSITNSGSLGKTKSIRARIRKLKKIRRKRKLVSPRVVVRAVLINISVRALHARQPNLPKSKF
jgi:hypothetical protein